jgi:uncharacterized protein (DUF2336 family)
LAEGLARDARSPRHVVLALAGDVPAVARPVLVASPVLQELDLVDLAAAHGDAGQRAIAARDEVPPSVAAALVAVGTAAACAELVSNPGAVLTEGTIARLVARHGADPDVRCALMNHANLPSALRQALLLKLSAALTGLVVRRSWLPRDRAQAAAREACDRATLAIAAEPGSALPPLVAHLRQSGQLTPTLLLRAVLSGHRALVCEALAQLAVVPSAHVAAMVTNRADAGLTALLRRARLPAATHALFRVALQLCPPEGEDGWPADRLRPEAVEAALSLYQKAGPAALDSLLALLRRFAAEAARERALDTAARLASAGVERTAA